MNGRIERWAPIGGIVFVALMVVGSMLVSDVPAPDAPEQQISRYLADSANHMRNIIGAYLWAVGASRFSGSSSVCETTYAEPKVGRAPCRT
jgi:hypothetical protein